MGAFLETETLSAPWILSLSWEELMTLLVCLFLDILEFIAPMLLTPLIGDVIDLVGFLFCAVYFNVIGAISLLELVPGLDIVPFFSLTWLTWYILRRRELRQRMEAELGEWL